VAELALDFGQAADPHSMFLLLPFVLRRRSGRATRRAVYLRGMSSDRGPTKALGSPGRSATSPDRAGKMKLGLAPGRSQPEAPGPTGVELQCRALNDG
jgi:hypothetical protein